MMLKVETWLCTNLLKCQVSSRLRDTCIIRPLCCPLAEKAHCWSWHSREPHQHLLLCLRCVSASWSPHPPWLCPDSSWRQISRYNHSSHSQQTELKTQSIQQENFSRLPVRLIRSLFGRSLIRKTSGPTYPGWAASWHCRGLASSQSSGASVNLAATRTPHKLSKLTVFHRCLGCYLWEYLQHLFFCLWQGVEFLLEWKGTSQLVKVVNDDLCMYLPLVYPH